MEPGPNYSGGPEDYGAVPSFGTRQPCPWKGVAARVSR